MTRDIGFEMKAFFDYTILRILLLVGIFFVGWLEAAALKRRDIACITWFWGLAALTTWIVYPLTAFRIFLGAIIFVSGMVIMVIYYRRKEKQ